MNTPVYRPTIESAKRMVERQGRRWNTLAEREYSKKMAPLLANCTDECFRDYSRIFNSSPDRHDVGDWI